MSPKRPLRSLLLGTLCIAGVQALMMSCGGTDFSPDGGEAGDGSHDEGGSGGREGSDGGAGNAGGTPDAAGSAGQATNGEAGATSGGVAGSPSGPECLPASTRVIMTFDRANPERVTTLQWVDSAGGKTLNLVAQGGNGACGDPTEFFGQSYAAPDGTAPQPVMDGHLATMVRCGLDLTITSAALDCADIPLVPVKTQYRFYDGAGVRGNQVRVTRTISFDETSPDWSTMGLRTYLPRVRASTFPTVIYPDGESTGVTTVEVSLCGFDCLVSKGSQWNGEWFANVDPVSGLALIVLRDPRSTALVELAINTDSWSFSNLSSFLLLQPEEGWKAPVTDAMYLCFADLDSWPQSERDGAKLPPGCGP